ncbi:MAG: efflux RND transporter periplasmic adaptor subunit [Verrucomicrobia bacterium]|nr:efflux RND transporter periplasmic adaptor subunit [Verrucomicrobiota bacterium]
MKQIQLCLAVALAVAFAGCKKQNAAGPTAGPPPAQVIAAVAKAQPVSEKLSLVGSVAANESVEIKSEADGTVLDVLFTEGQHVEKGALLLKLDERKLAASVDEADANFKLSKANHERAAQLLKDKLISPQEFDQTAATFQMNQASLQLKREQLKDARIYAPFEGTVSTRLVSPGQVISKNTTLTYLIDLDPVKVELNVPERFISQVSVGQVIDIGVATFPGRTFSGKVFFVSPFVDPATRTALVKAEIPNPKAELKPGMFANLNLTLKVKDNAIVIPETSLVPSGERVTVFVIGADGTAEARTVKVGMRMAGEVEIAEGLKVGERVVAEGVQKVRPGGKVKAAEPQGGEGERGNGGK